MPARAPALPVRVSATRLFRRRIYDLRRNFAAPIATHASSVGSSKLGSGTVVVGGVSGPMGIGGSPGMVGTVGEGGQTSGGKILGGMITENVVVGVGVRGVGGPSGVGGKISPGIGFG
jgi:hypothetical protein